MPSTAQCYLAPHSDTNHLRSCACLAVHQILWKGWRQAGSVSKLPLRPSSSSALVFEVPRINRAI